MMRPVFHLVLFILIAVYPVGTTFAQERLRQDVALDYMQAGQWDFASYEWRKALETDPGNIQAHLGLSESLGKAGFQTEAIRHLRETRRKFPDAELDLALAKLYRKAGKHASAISLYQQVLKKESLHPEAYKGLLTLRKHFPKSQKTALLSLLKTRALQAEVAANSAMLEGRYQEAVSGYGIADAYKPRNEVKNRYALALLFSGRRQEAVEQFKELTHRGRQWQWYANAALALLSLDQTYAARQQVEKALALAKNAADKAKLYNIMGYLYENAGKPAAAQFSYTRALELDPAFEKARMNLAYIYERDYQYEKAVELYRGVVESNPENTAAWNKLGFVYELIQESRKAREAYEKAITLQPDARDAYENLAALYEKMNKQDQADKVMKQWMDRQFTGMETGNKKPKETKAHRLFEFVDVFGGTGSV